MSFAAKTAAVAAATLALFSVSGCALDSADPDLEGGDEVELQYGQTESEVTTCSPQITAAAITKQISRIDEPVIDMQIVTISPKPYYWVTSSVVGGPSGARMFGYSSTCSDMGDGRYKCRHNFSISPGGGCYATGSYSLKLLAFNESPSACGTQGNWTAQSIPFGITSEYMCSTDFDGVVDGY